MINLMNVNFHAHIPVEFLYKNHEEITETRVVIPSGLYFGVTEWHREKQFFLHGFCIDRRAFRYFAIRDIMGMKWHHDKSPAKFPAPDTW